MNSEMLLAISDGYVRQNDGTLYEVKRGKTRIAVDVLDEEPQFGAHFERDFGVPGTSSTRSVHRSCELHVRPATIADNAAE